MFRPFNLVLLLALLVTCGNLSLVAQDDPAPRCIEYLVDLRDAKNHYVTVSMRVPATAASTQLMMAVWTPGSYLVREYSRHIDRIKAFDEENNELPIKKTRKNRWQVETGKLQTKMFRVQYRVYANELSVRTNWVGQQYAMLNGGATFLTVPEFIPNPHLVRLQLPDGWIQTATSLRATGDQPNTYVAESFHELVDSPIVAGKLNIYPFEVAGVTHQLVNVGENGFWDGAATAAKLAKIVEAHHDMWQTVPYDRYLFLNVICESGGGLEHDNSCLIMTSRWSFRDPKRFNDWLSLASHEFFHAWNVRRLRPKALVNYDYENEVYTPSLWVAEGVTSYYEDVLLRRAGLISQADYLDRLSSNIGRVQRSQGRLVQSLKESSYDTWIKFYRPNENSSNTSVSYYSKGAVVAFLLDIKIRGLTKNKKSLDDVMRKMYEDFSRDVGYTSEDFRNTASEIAGNDLSDWFALAVDSTEELDYAPALKWLGLDWTDTPPSSPGDKSIQQKDSDEDDKPWLGFSLNSSGRVSRVISNSPATEVGINVDDELLAINGFRFSGNLDTRLKQHEIGAPLSLLISRKGRLIEISIKIAARVQPSWKLKTVKSPNRRQRARLNKWLGKHSE